MSHRNNQPAFPLTEPLRQQSDCNGLTVREYAAIHIMAGIATSHHSIDAKADADWAIARADALLERLADNR